MKTIKFIAVLAALSFSMSGMCQTPMKWTGKASKEAIQEAKKMKKEGWQVPIGEPPLERQIDDAIRYRYDKDENNKSKYISGQGQSHAENYDVARMQAEELARAAIARNSGSMVTSTVKNMLTNSQLAKDKATSQSVIDAVINAVSDMNIGYTEVVVSAYRELPDNNKEVQIRLVAKSSDIQAGIENLTRAEMEKHGIK